MQLGKTRPMVMTAMIEKHQQKQEPQFDVIPGFDCRQFCDYSHRAHWRDCWNPWWPLHLPHQLSMQSIPKISSHCYCIHSLRNASWMPHYAIHR